MSLRDRLIHGFSASALGPAVVMVAQLVNVPLMLRSWGPELFGEWLLLSTIPSYLLVSDLGFGNVAGADMTVRVGSKDYTGAVETFQSISVFVSILSSTLILFITAAILVLPIHDLLHIQKMGINETRLTIALLSLNCLIVLQWSVLMSGYRCSGLYAKGTYYINFFRMAEGFSFLIVLLFKARPVHVAMVMVIISILGTTMLIQRLRSCTPWLVFGYRNATMQRVRALTAPAFAYMTFPMGVALTMQGTTTMVGLLLGPAAVAVFNPMRTLARLLYQVTDAIKNTMLPELSLAFGEGDLAKARRLNRLAFQSTLAILFLSVPCLALLGRWLFVHWTHGRLLFDRPTFSALLITLVFSSLWNVASGVALSSNRHSRIAVVNLLCASCSLVLCYFLLHRFGLVGAALASIAYDVAMCAFVFRVSLRFVGDTPLACLRSLFTLPQRKTT